MSTQKYQSSKPSQSALEKENKALREELYYAGMQNKFLKGQVQGEKGRYEWLETANTQLRETNNSLIAENKELLQQNFVYLNENSVLESQLKQQEARRQQELASLKGEVLKLSQRIDQSLGTSSLSTTTTTQPLSSFVSSFPPPVHYPQQFMPYGPVPPIYPVPPFPPYGVAQQIYGHPQPQSYHAPGSQPVLFTPVSFLQPVRTPPSVSKQSHVQRLRQQQSSKTSNSQSLRRVEGTIHASELEAKMLTESKEEASLPSDQELGELSKAELIKLLKAKDKESKKKSELLRAQESEHHEEIGCLEREITQTRSLADDVLHRRVKQSDNHMSMFS